MPKDFWILESPFIVESVDFVSVLNMVKILNATMLSKMFWSFEWSALHGSFLHYRVLLDGISIFNDVTSKPGKIENSVKIALHSGSRVFNFQIASQDLDDLFTIENLKIVLEEEEEETLA